MKRYFARVGRGRPLALSRETCARCGAPSGGGYLCPAHREQSRKWQLQRRHGETDAWRKSRRALIRELWLRRQERRYVYGPNGPAPQWLPSWWKFGTGCYLPLSDWATEPPHVAVLSECDDWRQALIMEGAS